MKKMGFKITRINGWKGLRGERARIIIRPKSFGKRVSYLSQLYFIRQPKYAFQILCLKNV